MISVTLFKTTQPSTLCPQTKKSQDHPRQPTRNNQAGETCPSLFTGTSLAKKDPKVRQSGPEINRGHEHEQNIKGEKLSPGTVAAIAKQETQVSGCSPDLDGWTDQLCQSGLFGTDNNKLDKDEIPAGVLPICFGILRDKERTDLGQASQWWSING